MPKTRHWKKKRGGRKTRRITHICPCSPDCGDCKRCNKKCFLQESPYDITIGDITVINLEKYKDRWQNIKRQALRLKNMPVNRWNATNGKNITPDEAKKGGVDETIAKFDKNKIVSTNAGEVGCWLSHKFLLEHLAKQNVPSNFGHLILEDDVDLPDNLLEKFKTIAKKIPQRWDIIYLSISGDIKNKKIAPNVVKATVNDNNGNYGAHSYMVRHGSINKILNELKTMKYAIDIQYRFSYDKLNVYIIDPGLIKLNNKLNVKSSIIEVQGNIRLSTAKKD